MKLEPGIYEHTTTFYYENGKWRSGQKARILNQIILIAELAIWVIVSFMFPQYFWYLVAYELGKTIVLTRLLWNLISRFRNGTSTLRSLDGKTDVIAEFRKKWAESK